MDKDTGNAIDIVLISFGTLFGISDFKSILGIVILCVQLIWVTLKVIFAIRDHIKSKQSERIVDDVKQYADDLTSISKTLEDHDDGDTENPDSK